MFFSYLCKSPLLSMNHLKTSFTFMDHTLEPSLHPASLHSVDTASCGKIPPISIALSVIKVPFAMEKKFLFNKSGLHNLRECKS